MIQSFLTKSKKLILTAVIINSYFISFAQAYDQDLHRLAGDWVYNQDGKNVEIFLSVVKDTIKGQSFENLQGYYIYKINGKIVKNTKSAKRQNLTGGYDMEAGSYVLKVFDVVKKMKVDILLSNEVGNPDEMQAKLVNHSDVIAVLEGRQPKVKKGFTLPEEMILRRKKD